MAKRNRQSVFDTMRQPGARMIQIAREVEKHGGVLPQENKVYSPEPIVRPDIDDSYLKKNYDLVKRFTPGPLDTMFDHTVILNTRISQPVESFTPVAGTQIVMWSYVVPSGQRFILNQYTFGALIRNSPVTEYYDYARPFEFYSPVAGLDFLILSNGKIPMNATYGITTNAGVNITIEGWACLSIDPMNDSNPNYGGIVIPFSGGTKIEIILRNHGYSYASPDFPRNVAQVFCKLRGFLSPVQPEEK